MVKLNSLQEERLQDKYSSVSQAAILTALLGGKEFRGHYSTLDSYTASQIVVIDTANGPELRQALVNISAGTAYDSTQWKDPVLKSANDKSIQQGTAMLYNKFVINGCIVAAVSSARRLQIYADTAYSATGVSTVMANGAIGLVPDDNTTSVTVPTNETTADVTYYAYVDYNSSSKTYKLEVATVVPSTGIPLYTVLVPASDTGTDLTKCTITDVRRIEPNYKYSYKSDPFVLVSLAQSIPDSPDYDVKCTVESASDMQAVGELIVYDKADNGFKIKSTGRADNVKIRWTLFDPDIN